MRLIIRTVQLFLLFCVSVIFITVEGSQRVIVVGGSSGMGKAAALEVLNAKGSVMLVSRSLEKLHSAKTYLLEALQEKHIEPCDIETEVCDITNEDNVQTLAEKLRGEVFDGLVVTAAGKAAHGPVLSLATQDTKELLESKLWGAYYCAKYLSPLLRDGGAVVFCAGILNRRPGMNCAPLAMANGALEGLTRSLALEWGPRLRVNCLSPGFCDTERFDHMDSTRKLAMMENTAASLPLRKVGQPKDMGEAFTFLLTAPFCTGVILDVDGGHGIRQYANPASDPMRRK